MTNPADQWEDFFGPYSKEDVDIMAKFYATNYSIEGIWDWFHEEAQNSDKTPEQIVDDLRCDASFKLYWRLHPGDSMDQWLHEAVENVKGIIEEGAV